MFVIHYLSEVFEGETILQGTMYLEFCDKNAKIIWHYIFFSYIEYIILKILCYGYELR